jgi:hypothetical protein
LVEGSNPSGPMLIMMLKFGSV